MDHIITPRKGLCLVEVSTRHVRIRTRVHNPTCLVENSTKHKPHPLLPMLVSSYFTIANFTASMLLRDFLTVQQVWLKEIKGREREGSLIYIL